jgi:hypothetical protein
MIPGYLSDGHHWQVNLVKGFATFFRALHLIAPTEATLALAGGACPPDVRAALQPLDVEPPGPISELLPIDFLYSICIPVSPPAMETLAQLADNHTEQDIANDVALFSPEASLLEWFDAPDDPISLSPVLGRSAVIRLAAAVAGTCEEMGRSLSAGTANVDVLAGRDLDIAVARHVLGQRVEERINTRTRERDTVYYILGGGWVRVPSYGTSIGDSSKIENALQRRGWRREEPSITGPVARVLLVHEDGRTVEAEGASLGEALCRAALKAVERS